MFRWEHQTRKICVCFYGDRESSEPVPHDNRLFNDALLYGATKLVVCNTS